jgi:chromate transporter
MFEILFKLFYTFMFIGLVTFGGGYAMVPLFQKYIVDSGWISSSMLSDMIGIAQMTPGPFSVNTATFVGMKMGGIWAAVVATVGIMVPSFVIVVLVAKAFDAFKESKYVKNALYGLRPVVTGMIAASALTIGIETFLNSGAVGQGLQSITSLSAGLSYIAQVVNFKTILIFAIVFIGSKYLKAHPILMIGISAGLGILLFVAF